MGGVSPAQMLKAQVQPQLCCRSREPRPGEGRGCVCCAGSPHTKPGRCQLCLSLPSASKGNHLHPGVKGKGQKDTKEEACGKSVTSHYGNAGPE